MVVAALAALLGTAACGDDTQTNAGLGEPGHTIIDGDGSGIGTGDFTSTPTPGTTKAGEAKTTQAGNNQASNTGGGAPPITSVTTPTPAATAGAQTVPQPPNVQVRGRVLCTNGMPVSGVYIDVSAPGSVEAFADWTPVSGNPAAANFSHNMVVPGLYAVNVGCGVRPDVPNEWASESSTLAAGGRGWLDSINVPVIRLQCYPPPSGDAKGPCK